MKLRIISLVLFIFGSHSLIRQVWLHFMVDSSKPQVYLSVEGNSDALYNVLAVLLTSNYYGKVEFSALLISWCNVRRPE